ncbi:unnamed protein product [Rotaria sp. Silwood2]|nr:unnamed protein product [Rotaria sp. Silwood2]CAF4199396.1 unnamed protein product [Rotaria sp. Silwood2]
MASNRSGKIDKRSSKSSSTRIIGSRHRSSEAPHVLLPRLKPLTSGRNVYFHDGNGRRQKQGEILIAGTHDEVIAEMNNQARINLTNTPQKRPRQDDSFEQQHNLKRKLASNPSISSNTIETPLSRSPSPLLSSLDQDVAFPLSSLTPSFLTTKTATLNSLSSKCSTTAANETSIQDNMADTASSLTLQQPLSLPSAVSPLIPTKAKASINPSITRPVVVSTTIKKMATGDALNEIKRLQSLVNSKDAEISQLTEQIKKLEQKVKKIAEHSICMPTDDVVVQ